MKKASAVSWREALRSQPGPDNIKDGLVLFVKGMCMGSADIIPGVSGGTIALITGIYYHLLEAIRSFRLESIRHLLQLNFKQAVATVHIRFLAFLLLGIGVALIALSHVMHFLIRTYPVPTWTFFLGLITASVFSIGKDIRHWRGSGGIAFITGVIMGYLMVGLIPVSTPETGGFIFFSGMIAICAMILPGISGAFILLILGKYEFITGIIKNPMADTHLITISIFISGCIIGILIFSRILSYLLQKYGNATLAVLTGFMAGSMRKIWPWKQILETKIIHGKIFILREKNIFPTEMDSMFFVACGMAVIGLLLIFCLEKVARNQ
jgi:putative membrane protein